MREFTIGLDDALANLFGVPPGIAVVCAGFSDGKVAIRWVTERGSVSVWDSFDDMIAIHGHPEYVSVVAKKPAWQNKGDEMDKWEAYEKAIEVAEQVLQETSDKAIEAANETYRKAKVAATQKLLQDD